MGLAPNSETQSDQAKNIMDEDFLLDKRSSPGKIWLKYEYMFIYDTGFSMSQGRLDESTASQVAELFRALADTSRVRIIAGLTTGEKSVGDLAELVELSHSAVSHHMRHLRQMQLVRARKEGRHVYYSLDDEHVDDLFRRGLEHVQHG